MMEKGLLEYRIVPVTRFIVTRFRQDGKAGSSSQHGEFDNPDTAYAVAYALCQKEHGDLGWLADDARVQYPRHPAHGVPVDPIAS